MIYFRLRGVSLTSCKSFESRHQLMYVTLFLLVIFCFKYMGWVQVTFDVTLSNVTTPDIFLIKSEF